MTLTLTRQIQIYPSSDEAKSLEEAIVSYADACNYVAPVAVKLKTTSNTKLHKLLYTEIRERFGLNSQIACSVFKTVCAKLKTIHATQPKWKITPHFEAKTLDLVWNRNYTLFDSGKVSISTPEGRVKVEAEWKGNEETRTQSEFFGTAVLKNKLGKWYLYIPVTQEIPYVSPLQCENVVGGDMGMNFLITTYDSHGKTQFYSGKDVKQKRGDYKQTRTDLQRKNTSSSRKRLASTGSRENRWMNDVNHCLSKALVERDEPTLFVLEDLTGIRSVTENVRKQDRYFSVSWTFHDLRQKISYKATKEGHVVVFVDPHYTSQRCPKCECVERRNRDKSKHVFKCIRCGYTSNDDRVAAMNLKWLGDIFRLTLASNIFRMLWVTVNLPGNLIPLVLPQLDVSGYESVTGLRIQSTTEVKEVGDALTVTGGCVVTTTGERQASHVSER